MKWWLTVMLYMAGRRGSMIPECVTKDVWGRQMRHQIGQDRNPLSRRRERGS
jgi:hypothetical protein